MRINYFAILFMIPFWLQAQNTILWEVEYVDGKVSYLLGTMHQMGNSFVDSLPIIKQKLVDSEEMPTKDLLQDKYLLAQKGKKNYYLIKVV